MLFGGSQNCFGEVTCPQSVVLVGPAHKQAQVQDGGRAPVGLTLGGGEWALSPPKGPGGRSQCMYLLPAVLREKST